MKQLPCFQHLNWQPDRRELRRFALAMLLGFGVLGLLAAVRAWSVGTTSFSLWLIGTALAVGALVPGLGRWVYLLVYVPTSVLGYGVSHVILTLLFYLIFTPLGGLLRLLGYDLLQLRAVRGQSNWRPAGGTRPADRYYHQF